MCMFQNVFVFFLYVSECVCACAHVCVLNQSAEYVKECECLLSLLLEQADECDCAYLWSWLPEHVNFYQEKIVDKKKKGNGMKRCVKISTRKYGGRCRCQLINVLQLPLEWKLFFYDS